MLPKIIFLSAVTAATLAVILLAVLSPTAHRRLQRETPSPPQVSLTLYVQHPRRPDSHRQARVDARTALVFHHALTDGPGNGSRVIGKAQGFIIPVEHFANSAFNVVYLTLDTPQYSGSLSVEARRLRHGATEELRVVGGTGSFAFARGVAVFTRLENRHWGIAGGGRGRTEVGAVYHVKLRLRFPAPEQDRTVPG